jgi:hypothetical protein
MRWGSCKRQARTGLHVYRIRVQRIRCKACGRTHSLLPDFLHSYRHYVISLLQRVVSLYLLAGLGINRLMERLIGQGPLSAASFSVHHPWRFLTNVLSHYVSLRVLAH